MHTWQKDSKKDYDDYDKFIGIRLTKHQHTFIKQGADSLESSMRNFIDKLIECYKTNEERFKNI
jgi:hypothetical protein